MCGIAVILSRHKNQNKQFIDRTLKLLHHRGPDAQDSWQSKNIGLAHTRLSIQDTSTAGNQPMISPGGRFVIIFNGEIYNHLDLRQKHLPNRTWRGHSDTETILALFEFLGVEMFSEFIGMWALAIWDCQDQRLLLSRDRFGQKPLYYRTLNNGSLEVSSEIKLLLTSNNSTSINPLMLSEYLSIGNYDHLFEETFFSEINSFPPAHYAWINSDTLQTFTPICYWSLDETPYEDRKPWNDKSAKLFRELTIDAINYRLLSDVSVGATLSGGLDSSIIVSCIAELGKKHFPVFTAQFPGHKEDESRYVRALKKKLGNSIEVIPAKVGKISILKDLKRVIAEQEEPFGDPSIIAHGCLVKSAKEQNVPVLLGGQGGDELSMGYPWMYYRLISYSFLHGERKAFLRFLNDMDTTLASKSRILFEGFLPSLAKELRLISRKKRKKWLKQRLQISSPHSSFGNASSFSNIYLESLKTVGLPHLCHYDDRSTMAYSVEGRMPFLDHRLFEFVSTYRPEAFIQNGYPKFLFRDSFKGQLPDEILTRKDKVGFFTPTSALIKNELTSILNILKGSQRIKSIVENKELNKIIEISLSDNQNTANDLKIFRLLSCHFWAEHFNVSF